MSQNGSVVLQAMDNMDTPATLFNIVDYISSISGVEPGEDFKDCIKKTVQADVRYGYVQKKNRKYFSAPLDMAHDLEDGSVPEDRSNMRRRRRSVRRGGSRGSRSRSSRR